jgi:hypothetical protein
MRYSQYVAGWDSGIDGGALLKNNRWFVLSACAGKDSGRAARPGAVPPPNGIALPFRHL